MPEAPLGRRYEEDEAEMDYGIDDALAYYDALTPEQQKEFATGLVALGYMGAGKETQSTLDVEWLVNPDDALQRESVAVALANVASAQNARMVAELGEGAAASGMDTANPLRNQYLPILGLEGGLFDTEEAKISDWDSFVREAQQTAGYLKTVDTRYITKATNDWAFRVYGRSATPDEIAVALNGAAALAEATPVGAGANQRLSDASLAVGAVAGIPIDQEEASQNATALINSAIGNYIMRNSRGPM